MATLRKDINSTTEADALVEAITLDLHSFIKKDDRVAYTLRVAIISI